ncbi:Paired amphipathic helix protein Sin3a [Thelohanellus kitauei]|uniref:Paired amphipathic helix protein Sin3a n=1 Tax=Thelohanellus kitauei TaxID=669202 RepID=A0A0C2MZV3_THEKT|nr:Paired amphipathic helix protein Sin3a [Thelohanellus kitauei]
MRRNEASYHEQRDQFYNYSRSVDPIHPYNGPGQRLPIPRNQAKHEEMALVSHNNAHFANTPYSYPQTNYGYPFLLPGGLDRFVDRFPDRYPSHRPLVFSTPNPLETLSVKAINKMQKTCSELKVEDALGYLEEVKKKYSDNPQIYADFLQIMKKFKMKEINTECVVNMIQKLFHGNPELISAFDVFLPPEYQSDSSLLPPPLPETPAVSNPPSIKHTEHTQPVSVHTEEPPHTTISQQQIVTSNRGFLEQASRGFTQSSFDHVKLPAVNTTLPTAVYESRNSQSNDAASVKRNQSGHIDTLVSFIHFPSHPDNIYLS